MFGLHGGEVVIGTTDQIVAAGGKLKNRDVGCRPERGCLLKEAFRIVEEGIESSGHIRLIGPNGESFRNLTRRGCDMGQSAGIGAGFPGLPPQSASRESRTRGVGR